MGQSLFLTAILLMNQRELLVIMITADKSIAEQMTCYEAKVMTQV